MTNKEIERYKKEIQEILSKEYNDLKSLEETRSKLQSIAKKVGASKYLGIITLKSLSEFTKSENMSEALVKCDGMRALITEVVYNIHDALRTETMINCSKTASRSLIAGIITATIALVSAGAAWFAVITN